MTRCCSYLTVMLLMLMLAGSLSAEGVPQTITYQGRLTDDLGNPVSDGGYWTRFYIYDVATGGTPLWTSDSMNILILDGLLIHSLGSSEPIPDDLFTDTSLYLAIKIGADPEMTPRRKLRSVPFAYHSLRADTAEYALAVADGNDTHWSTSDSVLYTNHFLGIARGEAGNILYGDSAYTHVNLGVACTTGSSGYNSFGATISGGYRNLADSNYATIGGGLHNKAHGRYGTIAGGEYNESRGVVSIIGGGYSNSATGNFSAILGGYDNQASGEYCAIGGGQDNITLGEHAFVGGGKDNEAEGPYGTIGGGDGNFAVARASSVGGGSSNVASGIGGTIPGGGANIASGEFSFAAGHTAHAQHGNTFVWSGVSGGASFGSSGAGQFLIEAPGGVAIGDNNPMGALDITQDSDEVCLHFSNGTKDITWMPLHALQIGQWDDSNWTERMRISHDGLVGINNTSPSYRLDCDGSIRCVSLTETSDVRLKKNIGTIDKALERIGALRGVSFEWTDPVESTPGRQFGVIAQEVEPVFPELVSTDNEGIKSVDYTKLTAVLIEALKEQQTTISTLETQVGELKLLVEELVSREMP